MVPEIFASDQPATAPVVPGLIVAIIVDWGNYVLRSTGRNGTRDRFPMVEQFIGTRSTRIHSWRTKDRLLALPHIALANQLISITVLARNLRIGRRLVLLGRHRLLFEVLIHLLLHVLDCLPQALEGPLLQIVQLQRIFLPVMRCVIEHLPCEPPCLIYDFTGHY